jgi:vesicle coat complex subunit
VRKTAVTGVCKLFRQAPDVVKNSDLTDVLYNMLRDKDTSVICNCVTALNEILASEGGMVFNQQIIRYLLKRIKEFNEWAQCVVLDLVSRYSPVDEAEMYDIMNLLEDRLKHSNSAVVLGTTKVFLTFTKDIPPVHAEVCKRLKAPLLTLMTSGGPELGFAICGHFKVLIARSPETFDDCFTSFFCRFNDPPCVKKLKLDTLTLLANQANFSQILTELAEYVTDLDQEIVRGSIRNIGKIAMQLDAAADEAIDHMLTFLDYNNEIVSTESVIILKDLLRKYPERYEEVLPALRKCLTEIDDTEGKLAVIWMIGEYGDAIEDAPYILEPFIDSFGDESSSEVRLGLLTTTTKLFFKRPPEVKAMLGRLFKTAIEDVSRVDVRDRALVYYRLLQVDVNEAMRVVNCPKVALESAISKEELETMRQIFEEFNSLAVIYEIPSEKFVKYVPPEEEEDAEGEDEGDAGDAGAEYDEPEPQQTQAQPQVQTQAPQPEIDLFGDAFAGGQQAAPPAAAAPALVLAAGAVVQSKEFQSSWGSWPLASELKIPCPVNVQQAAVEQKFASANISTMASGAMNGGYKFYFFARPSSGGLFLIEAIVLAAAGQASLKVKTDQAGLVARFEGIVRQVFASL